MMIRRSLACLVTFVFLNSLRLAAQIADVPDRLIQLKRNTLELSVQLKLDRKEYLAGEDATLTITVVNPTSKALEVLEPFNIKTGGINLQVKDPSKVAEFGTEWWGHSHPFSGPSLDAPSVILQPGTTLERKFRLSDDHFGLKLPILRGMPGKPGEYRLVYSYGGNLIEFQVIVPRLESWTKVQLQQPALLNDKGVVRELQRFVAILAVEDRGEHLVLASRCCAPLELFTDSMGKLTEFDARAIAPYVRIAKSSKPINFIDAVADASEKITIVWIDKDAKIFSLRLDEERQTLGTVQELPITLHLAGEPKIIIRSDGRPILEYTDHAGRGSHIEIP